MRSVLGTLHVITSFFCFVLFCFVFVVVLLYILLLVSLSVPFLIPLACLLSFSAVVLLISCLNISNLFF